MNSHVWLGSVAMVMHVSANFRRGEGTVASEVAVTAKSTSSTVTEEPEEEQEEKEEEEEEEGEKL